MPYRVVKIAQGQDYRFGIHEVLYDRSGQPEHIVDDPLVVQGCDLDEIWELWGEIREALDQPVLTFFDIVEPAVYLERHLRLVGAEEDARHG